MVLTSNHLSKDCNKYFFRILIAISEIISKCYNLRKETEVIMEILSSSYWDFWGQVAEILISSNSWIQKAKRKKYKVEWGDLHE